MHDLLVLVTMEAQSGTAPLDPRADEDHTRVQVKYVNTKSSWLRGAEQAAAILRTRDLFSSADVDWYEMSQSGVGMFKPDGASFAGLGAEAGDGEGDSAPAGGQVADAGASVDAGACRSVRHAKPKKTTGWNMRAGGASKTPARHAAKCSKSTPHTNRPVLCPMRPQKPGVVHWQLNMPARWTSAHSSGVPFVPDFAAQLGKTADERNWMRVVGGERRKVP